MSRLVAALTGALVATGILANIALADATPVQLVLLYIPNVSNTGTTSASGIAELVMQEGEFRLNATDLPRLAGDSQYVAWVVNSETNQFQRLGAFNTAESTSAVHFERVLPDAIPNKQWNLLLVTVEDRPDPARPSNKHSIAGVFPSPDNSPLPITLPNTGDGEDPVVRDQGSAVSRQADRLSNEVLATLTGMLGLVAGYVLGSRRGVRIDRPLTTNP
jgi:hypothetical protein